MLKLRQDFKHALQLYISQPDSTEAKSQLVSVGYHVYKQLANKINSIDINKIMPEVEGFLYSSLFFQLTLSREASDKMDRFIQACTFSDDYRILLSTHVLRMAYQFYCHGTRISIHEHKLRSELWLFEQEIANLHDKTIQRTMGCVHGLLMALVNQHFSLSKDEQKKNYVNLVSLSKDILLDSQSIVSRFVQFKTIIYNFLAAIAGLGLFYGLYLCATCHQRGSFFLQPNKDSRIAHQAAAEFLVRLNDERDYQQNSTDIK